MCLRQFWSRVVSPHQVPFFGDPTLLGSYLHKNVATKRRSWSFLNSLRRGENLIFPFPLTKLSPKPTLVPPTPVFVSTPILSQTSTNQLFSDELPPLDQSQSPTEIVLYRLPDLVEMRAFLLVVEHLYRKYNGHLQKFRRSLDMRNLLILFNILVGTKVSDCYLTDDSWETLAFHLLVAWHQITGWPYHRHNLILFLDELRFKF